MTPYGQVHTHLEEITLESYLWRAKAEKAEKDIKLNRDRVAETRMTGAYVVGTPVPNPTTDIRNYVDCILRMAPRK